MQIKRYSGGKLKKDLEQDTYRIIGLYHKPIQSVGYKKCSGNVADILSNVVTL